MLGSAGKGSRRRISPIPRSLHTGVVFVLAASVAFGVGGVLMKATDGLGRLGPLAAVVGLFVAGAVLLAVAVRHEGLSIAYVVGLGCESVVVLGLGHWLFDEHLSRAQLLGLALIAAGVASVRLG